MRGRILLAATGDSMLPMIIGGVVVVSLIVLVVAAVLYMKRR